MWDINATVKVLYKNTFMCLCACASCVCLCVVCICCVCICMYVCMEQPNGEVALGRVGTGVKNQAKDTTLDFTFH